MIRAWKRIGGACALLLLPSCTPLDYPSSWSRLQSVQPTRSCPMIAGLYLDEGIESHDRGGRFTEPCPLSWDCSLVNFLFVHRPSRLPLLQRKLFPESLPTHVQIIQPSDDVLEIVAWHGTGSTRKNLRSAHFSREKKDFTCGPEGLKLGRISGVFQAGSLGGGAGESEDRIFNRNEDGGLVLRRHRKAFGIVLLMPVIADDTAWYRWEAAPTIMP